ncbi:hypothetical protein MC885_010228, partial [Smutsia gigantea]
SGHRRAWGGGVGRENAPLTIPVLSQSCQSGLTRRGYGERGPAAGWKVEEQPEATGLGRGQVAAGPERRGPGRGGGANGQLLHLWATRPSSAGLARSADGESKSRAPAGRTGRGRKSGNDIRGLCWGGVVWAGSGRQGRQGQPGRRGGGRRPSAEPRSAGQHQGPFLGEFPAWSALPASPRPLSGPLLVRSGRRSLPAPPPRPLPCVPPRPAGGRSGPGRRVRGPGCEAATGDAARKLQPAPGLAMAAPRPPPAISVSVSAPVFYAPQKKFGPVVAPKPKVNPFRPGDNETPPANGAQRAQIGRVGEIPPPPVEDFPLPPPPLLGNADDAEGALGGAFPPPPPPIEEPF